MFPVAGDKKKASKNAQEMKTVEDQKAKMTGGNESDEFEVVSEEQVKAVLAQ